MNVRALSVRAVYWLSILTFTFVALAAVAPIASAVTVITQTGTGTGSTNVGGSSAFTDQITFTGSDGGNVSFVTVVTSPGLTVSGGGAIKTTGTLAVGTYTVSGTDSDASGDTGTWTYSLTVGASTITQAGSTSGNTTVNTSGAFTYQLTSLGGVGTVSYSVTTPSTGLNVSSTGVVSTTGTLAANTYTASGKLTDTDGDTGTWTYSLTVVGVGGVGGGGGGGGGGGLLTQGTPLSGSTTTKTINTTFSDQLAVLGASGTVTYSVSGGDTADLSVSSSGKITAKNLLAVGTYTVSGTDSDVSGDKGTWTYSLNVTSSTIGQAAPLSGTTTTAASNTTFSDQLAVTGASGALTFTVTGGDKSQFHVTSSGLISVITRLKQGSYTVSGLDNDTGGDTGTWTYTLVVSGEPAHTVFFNGNGGTGTMNAETKRAPASLTPNSFTRTGYTFVKWNTAANGSGTSYANGATYRFASSTTLYARWTTKKVYKVTFNANRGSGSMSVESDTAASPLTPNSFTRKGCTFVRWNTAANGSGTIYANGAMYAFTSSTTLYAQWKLKKVRAKVIVTPPAVHAVISISAFAKKSSILASGQKTEIASLAQRIRAGHDTHVSLVGYGDQLTAASQLNESAWAANFTLSAKRASQVESFLAQELAALHVTGCSITAVGNGSPILGSGTKGTLGRDREVIATLS